MSCPSPRTSAPRRTRAERGFSLIEVVVTTGLLMLVVGTLFGSFLSVQRSESTVRGRTTSLDELRLTMARMSKDLRQVVAVDAASTKERLVARAYIGGAVRDVVFEVDADGDLVRSVDGGASRLMQEGVLEPQIFTYGPADHDAVANPDVSDAQWVHIDLTLRPKALPETELTVEGEVQFRNRGST